MQGREITILGARYVFYGISEELAAEIRQLAGREAFQTDFRSWGLWLQSMLRKAGAVQAISKDDIIVVCNPYGMMEQDKSGISWQKLTGAEIPEQDKAGIIEEKARTAVSAFAKALEGNVNLEIQTWQERIKDMFTAFVRDDIGKIYGMQCANQSSGSYSSDGPFRTVLFIDFPSVMEDTPGLLLPIIMHETTHFLEEMAIDNGYAVENAQRNGVVIPDDIWEPGNSGSMGQDAGWAKIFCTERDYQSGRPQEKLTTLVEKMAAGSLYEEVDRGWVERLKQVFDMVLQGNNIRPE